ncbi:glycosyltransferase family 4 protein [Rhodoferax mekongensis]|uniref:glycosyltransferase family 4 protein n=1 Tax=Rhodoferax mekongensis TaxID=3068341 RepID=UPI0028BE40E3|nr:glycosyltransferase [Rhodoferax sp. TBRC 17199]MDT7516459.1 glycosyltransferase [Rhodoferax sp. TBRC 17199]
MKILLSAFACAPNTGSEAGGGWVYACELAKTHEVWVVTDSSRRALIEQFSQPLPSKLRFVYYRPHWMRSLGLNSKTAHLIYQAWQMGAWRIAKALDGQHRFDVCWHLTYGVFRQPSWMWKVGKPFVFGPVGGGERAPMRLWKSLPLGEKLRELSRDAVNHVAWLLPGLRATYKHADLVIARTEDTRRILPAWVQSKTKVQQEIGGYPARVDASQRKAHAGALKVLFAGRLLGWKGTHLAISAFAQYLTHGGKGEFTIVGEGPMNDALQAQVAQLGLESHVSFVGKLPQDELFRRYTEFDVLLFPSLHDSGGNVVIEALSFGLPVICLDLGGPSCFVDASCGVVVPAHHASEAEVVSALSRALKKMGDDAEWHQKLSRNALVRANDLTWKKQIERVEALVSEVMKKC